MSVFDPSLDVGAEPVARLRDLGAAERRFVDALRIWLLGPERQATVWSDFSGALGAARGRAALHAFETYLETVAYGVDRKLWRHKPCCPCLGRDEAALAAVMRLAAAGRRGEAMIEAASILRPDACEGVVAAGARLGRALGVAEDAREGPAPRGGPFRVLH